MAEDNQDEFQPELVSFHAFGHFFRNFPSALAEDLVTLENEGAIYSHFANVGKGPDKDGHYDFGYYRIKFQPAEIYQYVEASIAHEQYLQSFDTATTFEESLAAISDPVIAHRVKTYSADLVGDEIEMLGCFASFLPDGMEALVCGSDRGRYELLTPFAPDRSGFAQLMQVINNFPMAARIVEDRSHQRPPYLIANEYDVQDLLFAIIRSVFEDAKREEWTPQMAGSSKRIDIVIGSIQTVVKVKFVRDRAHSRSVADELRIDFECYHERVECEQFVALVFDPEHHVMDPDQFSKDLSGLRQKRAHSFNVSVLVR
jgi:hypothetical protein